MRFARLAFLSLALALVACEDPAAVGGGESIPERWQSVSAGMEHTCAIADDGNVWCWGRASTARLGFLSRVAPCNRRFCDKPVPVVSDLEFESLSAGNMHTCGVSRDTAYCWGWDWWGQLGDVLTAAQTCSEQQNSAELPCSLEPMPVALGFEIADASAGVDYSCAVTDDGDAYCWGIGQHGQLGVGFAKDSLLSPTLVAGGHDFERVSTGASHACALDDGGEIWCWGANPDGRLGTGAFADSHVPALVTDDPERSLALTWEDFDVGFIHACGVTTAGAAYCWGGGGGRIGDATELSWHYPRRVVLPDTTVAVAQISAGGTHACAVTTQSDLFCWGENPFGQVGDGTLDDRLEPRQIGGDIEWAQVSAGQNHTCAVDLDGRVYCWGQGSWGQLGNGDESDRTTPTPVAS